MSNERVEAIRRRLKSGSTEGALEEVLAALAQAEREREKALDRVANVTFERDKAWAEVERLRVGVAVEKAAHEACCENRLEILADLARVRTALEKLPDFTGAHYVDIVVRRGGKDQRYEADFLRHLRAALEGRG